MKEVKEEDLVSYFAVLLPGLFIKDCSKYSHHLVSTGELVQGPPQITKPNHAQVLYIK